MSSTAKKLISLNLALVLLLCLLLPAGAASGQSYLIVDGVKYDPNATHTGSGWSYMSAAGMGYLRLDGYIGGAIYLPGPASVEYSGDNLITAAAGESSLFCEGDLLSVGSIYPDATLTLYGGSGGRGVSGCGDVHLWGWGQFHCHGGEGFSAVWGAYTVDVTMEQFTLSGGNQMAITTDLGGLIRVCGAHKYYAGINASGAVESSFYGGEFYLRGEPAKAVITFDGNGGTVKGESTYTYSMTVTTTGADLTLYTPLLEGKTFLGWNSKPNGTGDAPPPRLFEGGEFLYYAQWDPPTNVLPLPEDMLAQDNAIIYAAIFYSSGQLWQVYTLDNSFSGLTIPELPEEGMTYLLCCVDKDTFVPLTGKETGPL